MCDSGVKLVSDYTMIYSGAPYDRKTRKAHSVAICLDPIATKVWKDSGSEWVPINERIIKIRLYCAPIHITVIAVYSPINPITKQMSDENDKFYNDLQDTLNDVSTKDMIIIMGDLNARVGKDQQKRQQHVIRSGIGPFTVDIENENGTRLIDFCEINNIIISNTFFKHKLVHQTSWMHPKNKKWHMIDYTLVNKKFRSSVEDVRMLRGAAGTIGTDHHLMRVKIRIHLKSRKKNVNSKKINVDSAKLKDDNLLEAFQKDLHDMFDDAKDDTISIDQRYELFLSQIKEKAKYHFSVDKNKNRKRKEWLTSDILKVIDQKSIAFVEWQNNRGSKWESKIHKNYKRLRKIVKIMTEQRQEEYWDEVCENIEKSIKNNDPVVTISFIFNTKKACLAAFFLSLIYISKV
jgi:exonuclease III